MKSIVCFVCVAASLATPVYAQSSRGQGWEFGAELLYQDSQEISFNGGSSASLEDDLGLGFVFGYRLSDRMELQFGIEWQDIDYDVLVNSDTLGVQFTGRGTLEAITPRAAFNFNFMEGAFTPFIGANIGYSFIDTNIPDAPPQNVCWWDPWWGYVCGTFQSTRSVEEFSYGAALGLRWDVSPGYSLRLSYQRQWLDLSEATTTPDSDQLRLGVVFRY